MLIEATTQSVEGPIYILTGNDDLNVAAGVVIATTGPGYGLPSGADGVTTWAGQHRFTIAGEIHSFDDSINTIGCDPAQTIEIAATGVLVAGNGGLSPDADGIILDGLNSSVLNHGSITAEGTGVSMFVRAGGTTTITNHGTISGAKAALHYKFGEGTLLFTNHGTVESPQWAYLGGAYQDHVINHGTLIGQVDLGAGDDLYDGATGTVQGIVVAGDGNDTLAAGNGAETMMGGAGIDLLDLSAAADRVRVDLLHPERNAGITVLGDVYTGFENVAGGALADTLRGDAGDNALSGNAGNDLLAGGNGADLLSGGDGNDTLSGGARIDVLTGGTGADWFEMLTPGPRDVITDFTSGTDRVVIDGAAFGLTGLAGPLDAGMFVRGNVPQDADDHFLYQRGNGHLWFDADGSGAGAAVMIADLQNGALMLATDIWIL